MGEGLSLADRFSYSKINSLSISCGNVDRANTSLQSCTLEYKESITLLPPEILLLKHLETLKIAFCPQLDLGAAFTLLAKSPSLKRLHITDCQIKEIPAEIKLLVYLSLLDFSNSISWGVSVNKLTTLPPEIGCLIRLNTLRLSNIRDFKSFPPEVAKLERLTAISLRGMKALPENIHLIPKLRSLDLTESNVRAKDLIPLVARPEGVDSLTVSDGYYNAFITLKEYCPTLGVSSQISLRNAY